LTSAVLLGAAAATAFVLARRLTGDSYAAVPAAAVFALSPAAVSIARIDRRLAVCVHLLPVLFMLFYRLTETPIDGPPGKRRLLSGVVVSVLGSQAYLDHRFATMAGLSIWIVLLTGFFMHSPRREGDWTEPFRTWTLCSLFGFLCYVPLWWMRRNTAGGWAVPPAPMGGADLLSLWIPAGGLPGQAAAYIGLAAAALAVFAVVRSRSYRQQTRLWAVLALLCLWLSLGPGVHCNGEYLWWVPALYRGVRRVGWLGSVPPLYFLVAAQLAMAVLCAFAMRTFWTLFPLKSLRWIRPLASAAAAALVVADYSR